MNNSSKYLKGNFVGTFEHSASIYEGEKMVTLLDEQNRIRGVINTDEVRSIRLSEEKLRKHADDLKSTNELKLLFIDILCHDLLNPASVIKGYSEHLLETMGSEEERSIVEKIYHQNERLMQIINTASMFGELESTDMISFEKLNLLDLLEKVSREFAPLLEQKGMILECPAQGSYQAYVNPIIEEAFSNLLSNAIKFSPKGSRLILDILDGDSSWEITFTDFGIGISDEYKDVIFTRFKRISSEGTKGCGLGLAIVKKIVELHGGEVGVYNNPLGVGSVFWIKVDKYRKMYDTSSSTDGYGFNRIEARSL
ncbi:HAMP domain-containing sensor histidine kinase [uncultured Methanomethylovorans sp.]|uniref:sensor histidine kinase n=1 Tax=uncultured Methanomethylovorans sp. TaxID=183759 RepID=UPI002AA8468A|nr:HAMP domain-containing sensor histidine kinase [uncultured Methanomethylovorans sp.]